MSCPYHYWILTFAGNDRNIFDEYALWNRFHNDFSEVHVYVGGGPDFGTGNTYWR
jgi:hypothetical protein